MKTLYLASGNAHKLSELQTMLEGLPLSARSAKALGGMPHVDENAPDFRGNARLKALALQKLAPADAWVMADDSGLVVDALDGAPGVYSARYAGANATDADNNTKLLKALEGVPAVERTARFVCVFCLLGSDLEEYFEGHCEGRMLDAPQGETGFGYDPLFLPEGQNMSFAQMGPNDKNGISHRGQAVLALKSWLSQKLQ